MQPLVVIDKCFLQGTPALQVKALAKTLQLVMSDGLFYELLTGAEPGRSRCFAKLPATDNPVVLVNHVGVLLRKEIDTQKPAGKPSLNRENIRFRFHPDLRNGTYVLPPEVREEIENLLVLFRQDVSSFIERSEGITDFFPDLLKGSQTSRDHARTEAEKTIVAPRSLVNFYSKLEPPLGETSLPAAANVDESWALYRWLQVQFLFSVDLCVRYQGKVPKNLSPKVFEKLEHDVLDAQVLMLGCLEGAFATRELKLQRWWRLLCPSGLLVE